MDATLPALRYFEDLRVGETVQLGSVTVSSAAIKAFATEFDPLPFHLDERAAKQSLLGGLAASGWHTLSLVNRQLFEHFLANTAVLRTQQLTDLKWKRPVLAGDTITASADIIALHNDQPQQAGLVEIAVAVRNQRQVEVMRFTESLIVQLRAATPVGEKSGAK